MLLKIRGAHESELAPLRRAILGPAAGDRLHERHVGVEAEGAELARLEGLRRVFRVRAQGLRGRGGEQHGDGSGAVGEEVDEALAGHALPGAGGGDAFGGGAAPEERVLFVREGRVRVGVAGGVLDFVHVVPGGGVEDVGVAVGFALREDGEGVVCGFEGGGGEVEAVKVGEVGLVAGRGGEGPVAEEGAEGVRGDAGRAVGTLVPDSAEAGLGRGGAGDGAVGGEGVLEGVVFEAALDEDCFVDGAPGVGSVGAPVVGFAPVESSCSFSDGF